MSTRKRDHRRGVEAGSARRSTAVAGTPYRVRLEHPVDYPIWLTGDGRQSAGGYHMVAMPAT